jgi:hypothetical protein
MNSCDKNIVTLQSCKINKSIKWSEFVVGLSGCGFKCCCVFVAAGYEVIGLFMKNWHDDSLPYQMIAHG